MIRTKYIIYLLLILSSLLHAQSEERLKLPVLVTASGETYSNVTVTSINGDVIRFLHSDGVSSIAISSIKKDSNSAKVFEADEKIKEQKQKELDAQHEAAKQNALVPKKKSIIEETLEDCIQKYGDPVSSEKMNSGLNEYKYTFKKSGYTIKVRILDDPNKTSFASAGGIINKFYQAEDFHPLTGAEVENILNNNIGEKKLESFNYISAVDNDPDLTKSDQQTDDGKIAIANNCTEYYVLLTNITLKKAYNLYVLQAKSQNSSSL